MKAITFLIGLVWLGGASALPPPVGWVREELEPLVVGKTGFDFTQRSFYRGSGEIEVVRIEGDKIHRWFIPAPTEAGLQLLPQFDTRGQVWRQYRNYRSEDNIELLFQMKLPRVPPGQDPRLYILQRLSDWESMEGIQYFSTSIQQMTTYIKEVKLVEGPGSHQPLPFPYPAMLPAAPIQFDVMQTDNKFAPCWYQFTASAAGKDALLIRFSNSTELQVPVLFFRFKALAAGDMLHSIYLILHPDRLELYTLSQLRNTVKEILGRPLDLANSFDRRMSAVQGWIAARLYQGD